MVPRKLNSLTGLRFFAASAIVIHHLHGFGLPTHILEGWLLDNGVGFFFVLSGFILAYVYPRLPSWHDVGRFWVARFARVWPAHVAALLLSYVLLEGDPSRFGTERDSIGMLLANVALVHAWIPYAEFFFSYNNVSWSLSTEVFFYLLFPVLIAAFNRTWWMKLAGMALLSLILIAASQAANLAVFTSMDQGLTLTGVIYIHPLARLFEFVLGMCAALLWRNVHGRVELSMAPATLVELGAIALMFVSAPAVAQAGAWANDQFGFAAAQWLGQGGGMSASFAVLVFVVAFQRGVVSRVLASRLFVLLGEISFMLYLIHYIVLRAYMLHAEIFNRMTGEARLILYLLVVFGFSWILYRFIEVPARGLILGAFDRRHARAQSVIGARP